MAIVAPHNSFLHNYGHYSFTRTIRNPSSSSLSLSLSLSSSLDTHLSHPLLHSVPDAFRPRPLRRLANGLENRVSTCAESISSNEVLLSPPRNLPELLPRPVKPGSAVLEERGGGVSDVEMPGFCEDGGSGEAEESDPPPPPPPREHVVRALQRLDAIAEDSELTAADVFAAFSDWDEPLSARDIVAILNQQLRWRVALGFFRWVKENQPLFEVNVYTYNVMYKCLRTGLQWDLAMQLWEDMNRNGIYPDNVTYSTLISFAARRECVEDAVRFYERMQHAGLDPDPITRSAIIDIYSRMGRVEEAKEVYEKVRRDSTNLDNVTLSLMIKMYSKEGDFDAVMSIYQDMRANMVKPNVITYNSLLGALAKAGKTKKGIQIFKEMMEQKVKPTVVTWTLLVRIYVKAGLAREAVGLIRRIKRECDSMDTLLYNALLNSCAEAGMVEEGKALFKEMVEGSETCKPDDWTYGALVYMYTASGMMDEARNAHQMMLHAGFTPNCMVHTSMLNGYKRINNVKSMKEYFDGVIAEGLPADDWYSGTFLTVLTSCNSKEEGEIVRECIAKLNPKLHTMLGTLFQLDFVADEIERDLKELLSVTERTSHRPFCNMLQDLCWARNMGDRALCIFEKALVLGVYGNVYSKVASSWGLNLRFLSFGAARTAFLSFLNEFRVATEKKENVPSTMLIESGLGKKRELDDVSMTDYMHSLVGELAAPFEESETSKGLFVASAEALELWLQSTSAAVGL